MDIDAKIDSLLQALLEWSPKLVGAILVLFIGLWLVKKVTAMIKAAFDRSLLDDDVKPFLLSIINAAMKIAVVLTSASILGFEMSSLAAFVAAIVFAIGMALQGSLGHIASGILILIFRPYKMGDLITVGEHRGFVKEVQIISTILETIDKEIIIIPNGTAISEVIINSSEGDGMLRLDIEVYMPYDEEFDKVERIINDALATCQYVQADPKPKVGIKTFDTHSIILSVKPYTLVEDYENGYYEVTRKVKSALGEHGIKVAYSEGVELGPIGK